MGCCNTNNKCLIVTTINPICHSHPVHLGTKKLRIRSCKSKENITFAHNFIWIQNTKQATHCFVFHLSIFFLVKGLDTSNQLQSILTLIVQTIVSVVLGAFSKQQQGPLKVSDMIYIKTQVFRLLRYYSPAPRNIARSDWATQNITHNMTSSLI